MSDMNYRLKQFHWIIHLLFVICLFSHTANADRGDTLVVNSEIVNLRTQPSVTSQIVKRLARNHEVIEISRYDDWVEVGTKDKGLDYGWIHGPLLVTKQGTAVSSLQNDSFSVFRTQFVALIKDIEKQTGIIPFTEVEQQDEGSLQLTSSKDWLSLAPEQRDELLTEVFDLWRKYVATGLSVSVDVIDENGNQYMMMFR